MGTGTFSIEYRPVRVGFVVRDGNVDDLVKAAGLNTLLWGGMYNPIVPARDGSQLPAYLIDAFQLDVLLPALDNENTLVDYVKRFPHLATFSGDYALSKSFAGRGVAPRYLDVTSLFLLLWQSDFKLRDGDHKSEFVLAKWREDDSLRALYSLLFGHYPRLTGQSYDFEATLLKRCRASTIEIDANAGLPAELCAPWVSPIKATARKLVGRHAVHVGDGGVAHHGVCVGDPDNFDDLLNFWNLRATGLSIEFIPVGHQDHFRAYIGTHLGALEDRSKGLHSFFREIGVYYRHDNERATKTASEALGNDRKVLHCGWDDVLWNGLNIVPFIFSFDTRQALGNVEMTESGYRVSFGLPERAFAPSEHPFAEEQEVTVLVDSYCEFMYPAHTLKPPYVSKLNQSYGRLAQSLPWVVRAKRDGIGLLLTASHDTVSISPLEHAAIVASMFDAAGMSTEPSQAGLLARRITEQLGGVEKAAVFRIPGVRRILRESKPDQSVARGCANKVISDGGSFKRFESMVLGGKTKITPDDVIAFLLQKGFLRAGLELTCPRCNLPNWIPLGGVDEFWVCEYCGNRDQTSLQLRSSGYWRFRRSGLFGRDNNQEGAVPVILSMLRFAGQGLLPFQQPLLAPSLKVRVDGQNMEFDFFVVNYVCDSRVELGVGEAKSSGSRIDQEDIDHFLVIRPRIESLGITCVPIFATTAESFSDAELGLLKQLVGPGKSPLILTVGDLEDEQGFLNAPELPWQKEVILNLSHKADNSRHKYLHLDFDNNPLPPSGPQQ